MPLNCEILDVACGTGVVSEECRLAGYKTVGENGRKKINRKILECKLEIYFDGQRESDCERERESICATGFLSK